MSRYGPVSRRDLIRYLRQLGFTGPEPGGSHEYLVKQGKRIHIPNPHQSDIGTDLLARILRHAGVSRDEWEAL